MTTDKLHVNKDVDLFKIRTISLLRASYSGY